MSTCKLPAIFLPRRTDGEEATAYAFDRCRPPQTSSVSESVLHPRAALWSLSAKDAAFL